jgi:hypothetical protein
MAKEAAHRVLGENEHFRVILTNEMRNYRLTPNRANRRIN